MNVKDRLEIFQNRQGITARDDLLSLIRVLDSTTVNELAEQLDMQVRQYRGWYQVYPSNVTLFLNKVTPRRAFDWWHLSDGTKVRSDDPQYKSSSPIRETRKLEDLKVILFSLLIRRNRV